MLNFAPGAFLLRCMRTRGSATPWRKPGLSQGTASIHGLWKHDARRSVALRLTTVTSTVAQGNCTELSFLPVFMRTRV